MAKSTDLVQGDGAQRLGRDLGYSANAPCRLHLQVQFLITSVCLVMKIANSPTGAVFYDVNI